MLGPHVTFPLVVALMAQAPGPPPNAPPPPPPSQPNAGPPGTAPSPTPVAGAPIARPPGMGDAPPPPRADPSVVAPVDPEVEEKPADLSEAWNFAHGGSPPPRYVRQTDGGVVYGPNPIGFYSGVSVEGNQVPPQAPAATGTKPALLTWTGFERGKATSRVFFQVNANAAHELQQKGKTVVLRLKNTKIHGRNNRRPLDLRYFKTPIETVALAQRGKDTVITVALKREATPALSSKPSGAGYSIIVLEFGDAP